MYERLRINLKVERGLTFTNTRDLPYIVSIYLRAEDLRVYVRTEKLRDSGNQP